MTCGFKQPPHLDLVWGHRQLLARMWVGPRKWGWIEIRIHDRERALLRNKKSRLRALFLMRVGQAAAVSKDVVRTHRNFAPRLGRQSVSVSTTCRRSWYE